MIILKYRIEIKMGSLEYIYIYLNEMVGKISKIYRTGSSARVVLPHSQKH